MSARLGSARLGRSRLRCARLGSARFRFFGCNHKHGNSFERTVSLRTVPVETSDIIGKVKARLFYMLLRITSTKVQLEWHIVYVEEFLSFSMLQVFDTLTNCEGMSRKKAASQSSNRYCGNHRNCGATLRLWRLIRGQICDSLLMAGRTQDTFFTNYLSF